MKRMSGGNLSKVPTWMWVIVSILVLLLCYVAMQKQGYKMWGNDNCDTCKGDTLVMNEDEDNVTTNNTVVIVERDDPTIIGGIKRTPLELLAMDRVNNPLRYPYRSPDFYETTNPSVFDPTSYSMPFQVIGCGGRKEPCYGGSQKVIPTYMNPVVVSERNIAPINITTRGPIGQPQQVGILTQIFGSENDVHPLYGRRKYPNDNKWEYYTQMGLYGVKVPVITPRRDVELGTGDQVFITGLKGKAFRVTMYEQDYPQYIPF